MRVIFILWIIIIRIDNNDIDLCRKYSIVQSNGDKCSIILKKTYQRISDFNTGYL